MELKHIVWAALGYLVIAPALYALGLYLMGEW